MDRESPSLLLAMSVAATLLALLPPPLCAGTAVASRLGKYNMLSYGAVGRPPLYIGHIELQAGGTYRISRTSKADYYGEGSNRGKQRTSRVCFMGIRHCPAFPCKEAKSSSPRLVLRE